MKILLVTTISNTINSFLGTQIKKMNELGYTLDVATKINQDIILDKLVNQVFNIHFSRRPFSFRNIKAYFAISKILKNNYYDLIYTHTPIASFIVRLSNKNQKKMAKVIYVAHGFHFHKNAKYLSWLLYYPLEKWLSKYTTTIITINKEDYELAQKKFRSCKIFHINGIGFNYYNYHQKNRLLNTTDTTDFNKPIQLISVGELNNNKNHINVIKTLKLSRISNYEYRIFGKGIKYKYLKHIIKKWKMDKNIFLMGYKENIFDYMIISDIYIHPSKREGLPISILEAMASGLPILASNTRGNNDIIVNEKNGFLYDLNDKNDLTTKLMYLVNNRNARNKIGMINMSDAKNYSDRIITKKYISIIEKTLGDEYEINRRP